MPTETDLKHVRENTPMLKNVAERALNAITRNVELRTEISNRLSLIVPEPPRKEDGEARKLPHPEESDTFVYHMNDILNELEINNTRFQYVLEHLISII